MAMYRYILAISSGKERKGSVHSNDICSATEMRRVCEGNRGIMRRSAQICAATKRLSSRERVYIRWARPVVTPCSRHRWLTLHTHACSCNDRYDEARRSSNPVSGHFSMQIFRWTTRPARLTNGGAYYKHRGILIEHLEKQSGRICRGKMKVVGRNFKKVFFLYEKSSSFVPSLRYNVIINCTFEFAAIFASSCWQS